MASRAAVRAATAAARSYEMHPAALTGVAPAIVTSSTFQLESAAQAARLSVKDEAVWNDEDGFFYSRWGSPTSQVAARAISELERAKGTALFSSGMAAITATLLSELSAGEHAVFPKALYGGTFEFIESWASRFGIEAELVDPTAESYAAAVKPSTKLLYVESPANPTMRITDLAAVGQVATEHGLLAVVDGTFATPYHVRPLETPGITAVIHAATKYLGGHSDLLAGSVSSNDLALLTRLGKAQKLLGAPLSAFDSFLVARGIKSFDVRMERHARNAAVVAAFLDADPRVSATYYPGLASHPDHELAVRQFRPDTGFGGMIAFEAAGGLAAGQRLVESVELATLAVSLGGVETLIEHPASMTHAMLPRDARLDAGVTDGLIRLSVGLEDPVDLCADLDRALGPR